MSYVGGERIQGIDAPLPPGERVRWEGRPSFASLARQAFHVRTVLVYFGVLALVRVGAGVAGRQPAPTVMVAAASVFALGLLAAGLSLLLAWLSARTTVYAITDRRVVLKVGMVVSGTVNIPFRLIDKVDTRRYRDGTVDFALCLSGEERIPYSQLWPYARPWRLNRPEPMLRSVPGGDEVGVILRDALVAFGGRPAEVQPMAVERTRSAVAARDRATRTELMVTASSR
jgi:hypothetical protein